MNTMEYGCGHLGPAIGAPNSLARLKAALAPCTVCQMFDDIEFEHISGMTLKAVYRGPNGYEKSAMVEADQIYIREHSAEALVLGVFVPIKVTNGF